MKYIIGLILLLFISCGDANEADPVLQREGDYFARIVSNDIALETPKPGEWLYEHKEPGQSFQQYKKSAPPRCTDSNYLIYLKPVGHFSNLQQGVLKLTRQYVEIFFQQKTVLLETVPDTRVPAGARRMRTEGYEQLLASYILDTMLKGQIPAKGIVVMAITEKDLYPKEDWNFVFGLASYKDRVGVSSIYRLQDEALHTGNFTKCLERLIKVSTHEIGHMFSLHHCTYARCLMNGSNHLGETDAAPARLCSQCQKKLLWNMRFDINKRLRKLAEFFASNHLQSELKLCRLDMEHSKAN
jgi:archaemetzincin